MKNRLIEVSFVLLSSLLADPDAMADNQSKGPPLLNFTFSGRPPTAAAFDAKLRASLTKAGVKILSSGDDLPKAGDFCVAKDKVDAKDPLSSIIYVCNSSRSVYDVVTNEYYAYTVPAASEGKMLAMNVSPAFECFFHSKCRSVNDKPTDSPFCLLQEGGDGNVACYHLGYAKAADYRDHICHPVQ